MADRTEFCAEGYRFATTDDAKQALLEKKKAAYFESKLVNRNPQNMLSVYDKILDEKVFLTPAGWEYLKRLQEELRLLGIEEEKIRPIPMYVTFVHHNNREEASARQRIKPAKKKDAAKSRFIISVLINVILGFMVAAMFVISLNSSNPNILNYKKNIENEYAAWEQELTEREKELRLKQAQLEQDQADVEADKED
ncbi:MAG: hypothetical protein K2H52_05330 [Lachnospiraceae bacterium]|nr:hypothetical protein [Lachnospiraceae bacterium]